MTTACTTSPSATRIARRRLTYAATIHHGVPIEDFAFDAVGSEDLLFFGRIHPDKGAGEAIRVARAAGRRLNCAGWSRTRAITSARWRRSWTTTGSIIAG